MAGARTDTTRTILKFAALAVAVVAAALALNPSPETHRETISRALSSRSEIASLLRLGRVTAFFSEYHSLAVASYTTVNGEVVSIGAFGYVHVRDRDVVRATE
ncbi:MAG: hypothetical protein KDH17_20635 [Rhodocyclaceae bacterium]|nr:hypothetical protein [Rhodocyclaceae bacterium]